jgi:hypothetical protein
MVPPQAAKGLDEKLIVWQLLGQALQKDFVRCILNEIDERHKAMLDHS